MSLFDSGSQSHASPAVTEDVHMVKASFRLFAMIPLYILQSLVFFLKLCDSKGGLPRRSQNHSIQVE